MAKDTVNNIKLGIFVTVGMLVLIISLYMIGKNQSFFGSNFYLYARFRNISGLTQGNNVRYSGIQAGTVNKIRVIDDTTIEVTLVISKKMKPFIKQNAEASIGNEGLMGNKVINITPNTQPAPEIEDGGMLITRRITNTDDMMQVLSVTNENVSAISENLKDAVIRINNSKALWNILEDTSISEGLHASMANIRMASARINEMSVSLDAIISDVHEGKGAAGAILADKNVADNIRQAVANINTASREATVVVAKADSIVQQLQRDASNGKGTLHAVLKDTGMVVKLNTSLQNIEKGTAAFNENMEALKHNVLTRGYFKKKARQERKNK